VKIQFSCSKCGKRLAVDEIHAGKKARCACGASVVVPMPEGAAAPAAPAAQRAQNGSVQSAPAKKAADKEDLGDAPFSRPHHQLDEDLVDMTAMVDIVFFILIFFLVTSLQAIQASIEMPRTKPEEGATGKSVEQIEQAGEFVIVRIDADDKVWVNDSEAPTVQVVVSKLRNARQDRGGRQGPSKMLVLANSEARYGTIVSVLDAGTHVGMDDVQLGGDDEEEAP
jgi:biopolymer transport protein ExbD